MPLHTSFRWRLCSVSVLTTALVVGQSYPSVVAAEDPADTEKLDAEAAREFDTAISTQEQNPAAAARAAARAARIWLRLVQAAADDSSKADWRQIRIGKTLNSYRLAYQLTEDCQYIREATQAADQYLGSIPESSSNHTFTAEHKASISDSAPECTNEEDTSEVPTPPQDNDGSSDSDGEREGPEQPPAVELPKDEVSDNAKTSKLYVGLAISSGILTGVALGVSLGTGLSRLREPFAGSSYKKILTAAQASYQDSDPSNDVPFGANDDMCAAARANGGINQEVESACDRWDTLGTVAVATGTATAVFAVSTVVFSVLAARKKRREQNLAFSIAPTPGFQGGTVAAKLRF